MSTTPAKDMDSKEIAAWLENLNFESAANEIMKNNINGLSFTTFSGEDFESLGIPPNGFKRSHFNRMLVDLKTHGYSPEGNNSTSTTTTTTTTGSPLSSYTDANPTKSGFMEWLIEVGIVKYAKAFESADYDSVTVIKTFDRTQFDRMIDVVGLSEGAIIKINHWYSKNTITTVSPPSYTDANPKKSVFMEWLTEVGISKYAKAFESAEYDSLSVIKTFDRKQFDHMIEVVGLSEGAIIKINHWYTKNTSKRMSSERKKENEEKWTTCENILAKSFVHSIATDMKIGDREVATWDGRERELGDRTINNIASTLSWSFGDNCMYLFLRSNRITDDGASGLARMIKCNTTLLRLDVSKNLITGIGGVKLAEALCQNETLFAFSSLENKISFIDRRKMKKILKSKSSGFFNIDYGVEILNPKYNKDDICAYTLYLLVRNQIKHFPHQEPHLKSLKIKRCINAHIDRKAYQFYSTLPKPCHTGNYSTKS